MMSRSIATAAVAVLAAGSLAACSEKREAEVSTGTAEAEVSTSLPES